MAIHQGTAEDQRRSERLRQCDREASMIVLDKKRKRLKDKTVQLDWTDQKEIDFVSFSLASKRGLDPGRRYR